MMGNYLFRVIVVFLISVILPVRPDRFDYCKRIYTNQAYGGTETAGSTSDPEDSLQKFHLIPNQPDEDVMSFDLSPDGTKIVSLSTRFPSRTRHVWIFAVEGTERNEILFGGDGPRYSANWMNNGSEIVTVVRHDGGEQKVMAYNLDTKEKRIMSVYENNEVKMLTVAGKASEYAIVATRFGEVIALGSNNNRKGIFKVPQNEEVICLSPVRGTGKVAILYGGKFEPEPKLSLFDLQTMEGERSNQIDWLFSKNKSFYRAVRLSWNVPGTLLVTAAWSSGDPRMGTHNNGIFRISKRGWSVKQIWTPRTAESALWSPDGSAIYFIMNQLDGPDGTNAKVYRLESDGVRYQ